MTPYQYIGVAVAAILLIVFAFLAVVMVSRAVSKNIRQRTLDLISAYDDIMEKRSQTVEAKEKEIEEKQAQNNGNVIIKYVEVNKNPMKQISAMDIVSGFASSRYSTKTMGSVYKTIRQEFNFDVVEELKKLPNNAFDRSVGPATKALKKVNFEEVSNILALAPVNQYQEVKNLLGEECGQLLTDFCQNPAGFSVIDFYDYIQQIADTEPKGCIVYAPPYLSLKNIPENVTVKIDDGICEGFVIEADGQIYDYSIRERDIG